MEVTLQNWVIHQNGWSNYLKTIFGKRQKKMLGIMFLDLKAEEGNLYDKASVWWLNVCWAMQKLSDPKGTRISKPCQVFPTTPSPYFFANISTNGFISGTHPPSKFFYPVWGKVKISFSVFWALIVFSLK